MGDGALPDNGLDVRGARRGSLNCEQLEKINEISGEGERLEARFHK